MREQQTIAGGNGYGPGNGTFELSYKPTDNSVKPIIIQYSALAALPRLMPTLNLKPNLHEQPTENVPEAGDRTPEVDDRIPEVIPKENETSYL